MRRKKAKVKKRSPLTLVVVLLLIAVVGVELAHVHQQIETGHEEYASLSDQELHQKQANAALKEDLDRADDSEFLKDKARELMDMAEQGERIFYDVNHNH